LIIIIKITMMMMMKMMMMMMMMMIIIIIIIFTREAPVTLSGFQGGPPKALAGSIANRLEIGGLDLK